MSEFTERMKSVTVSVKRILKGVPDRPKHMVILRWVHDNWRRIERERNLNSICYMMCSELRLSEAAKAAALKGFS